MEEDTRIHSPSEELMCMDKDLEEGQWELEKVTMQHH